MSGPGLGSAAIVLISWPLSALALVAAIVLAIVMLARNRPHDSTNPVGNALGSHSRLVAALVIVVAIPSLLVAAVLGTLGSSQVGDLGPAVVALTVGLLLAAGALALGEGTWPRLPNAVSQAPLRRRRIADLVPTWRPLAAIGGLAFGWAVFAAAAADRLTQWPAGLSWFAVAEGVTATHFEPTLSAPQPPSEAWASFASVSVCAVIVGGILWLSLVRVARRAAICGLPLVLDQEIRRLTALRMTRIAAFFAVLFILAALAMVLAPVLADGFQHREWMDPDSRAEFGRNIVPTPAAIGVAVTGALGALGLLVATLFPARPAIDFYADR